jgi:MFS family permease
VGGQYHGWRVVAAAFGVNAVHDGTYSPGFAVFFLPISRDLGLSRAAASLPFTVNKVIPAILGPFMGALIDRVGPGRVLFVGALLCGMGFVMLWRTTSYALLMVALVGFVSLGMKAFLSCTAAAVAQWFERKRARAMAASNLGFSIGATVLPPLLAVGVSALGWRTTSLLVGVGIWTLVLPLATQIGGSPERMGLRLDGDPPTRPSPPSHGTTPRPGPAQRDLTPGEAVRTRVFWLLSVNIGLQAFVASTMAVHLVAIMTWKGIEETAAGFLVGVMAVAGIPWVLIAGWIGDRWPKGRILASANVMRGLAWFALVVTDDLEAGQMAIILVLFALSEPIYTVYTAMVADLFGRRHYATLSGLLEIVAGGMGMGAPLFAGWTFDVTQSYAWFAAPVGSLMLLSALMFWFMPDRLAPRAGAP